MEISQKRLQDRIIKWIKSKVNEADMDGVVFGLSGGIDSAVVGALCLKAFPNKHLGIIMPCHSSPIDSSDAKLLKQTININTHEVDLSNVYDVFLNTIKPTNNETSDVVTANIKPRLRMMTLYYYAALKNYLVVGTGNKSEIFIGYFTKYGDGGVDILPIADLTKKEVVELAYSLEIPKKIITKPPSAGLWEDQTDEGEMGITYKELDEYITHGKGNMTLVQMVQGMHEKSEHKRRTPEIFYKDNIYFVDK